MQLVLAHLVRAANGPAPFAAFARSYRELPAGVGHELLLICKGFDRDDAVASLVNAFDDVPTRTYRVADDGVDLTAYAAAARVHPAEYFCFVNSFSVLLDAGWLGKLYAHASRPDVGVVGATGSWESAATAARGPAEPVPRTLHPRRLAAWLWYRGRGAYRAATRARRYAPFPNPHVRTNAFMIRRDLLLDLLPRAIRTKAGAERLESGKRGLTAQLRARGLRALVVGRDGRGYEPEQWPDSRTFRSGEQQNLLVADNRTRQFADGDPATRRWLAELAWGARAAP